MFLPKTILKKLEKEKTIMKKISWMINAVLGALLIFIVLQSNTTSEKAPKPESKSSKAESATFFDLQHMKAVPLPSSMNFCGENVPLYDYDVKERLDRELLSNTYWHSNTIRNIKLAHKYFPIIEPILAQNGIPNDFKYLAVIESSLQANARSSAGAVGYWQFLKTTAKENGLEVATEVDERRHIEKSTQAACKYLKKVFNRFGNWTLAAAAYNAGGSGINTQLTKQKANSYYDLVLNSETSRYVFRILAVKLILEQPEKYGFDVPQSERYHNVAYRIETVKSIPNIADFALSRNTTYKQIKLLNPWLRTTQLSARSSGKVYEIKVPL